MSFKNRRYITRGVRDKVPLLIQLFLWQCIDELNEHKDKLQIFKCSMCDGRLNIIHIQEESEYKREYQFTADTPIFIGKIYAIDDGDYSTMLLADEY